ncbi:MAG: hydroxyacylglutathione hydrolase [Bdellovibrionales bacterium]
MIDVHLIPIIPSMANYAFVLEADDGSIGVVDPGDAEPIIDFLDKRGLKPDVILITHHHWDHVDGLRDMMNWHSCPVVGAEHPHGNPAVSFQRTLKEGNDFSFGGEVVQVLDTPGHCREHICFYFSDSHFVLSGDALFVMGCGRLLDGTAEELYSSLQKLVRLPDETKVYCGHEYTLSNAKFCAYISPEDIRIKERLIKVKSIRHAGNSTVPSTIGLEKETNVFLHAKSAAEFAALRQVKDTF